MKTKYPFSITLIVLLMMGCSKDDPMRPCPNEQIKVQYDDGSFERGRFGSVQDQALLVHFTAPCYPAALVEVSMRLFRTDTFTLAVWDFRTGEAIIAIEANGVSDSSFEWVDFDMRDLRIKVNNDFWVGIKYSGEPDPPNSKNWYPVVSSDTTRPAGRSFFLPPIPGSTAGRLAKDNLAIRATVETGSTIAELKTEEKNRDVAFAFVRRGKQRCDLM